MKPNSSSHDSPGVLVVNLGTPQGSSQGSSQGPSKKQVSRYLREFLMDGYVIDIPFFFRWLLVNGIIVPFRSERSSKAYKSIWWPEGSPLLVLSQRFTDKLEKKLNQTKLNQTNSPLPTVLGMRYGQPSIAQAITQLKKQGAQSLVVFLMYPQFAQSSTQTAIDEVKKQAQNLSYDLEKIHFITDFYEEDFYINCLNQSLVNHWQNDKYDHLLLSYHSLPVNHLKKLAPHHCYQNLNCCDAYKKKAPNCYRAQCYQTSSKISIDAQKISTSFQSRLGRQAWIEPNTEVVIAQLARKGVKNLLVAAPSFTVDCLETLEELQIRGQEIFKAEGGQTFKLVPCLNDSDLWVEGCAEKIRKTLA